MARDDRPNVSRRHLVHALLGRDIPAEQPNAPAPDRHAAGDAAYAAGDYAAAIPAYRASIRGDLSNAPVRARLGHALYTTGAFIQARVEFEHVLRLTGGRAPMARLCLGLTLLALGKTEKALLTLEAFADADRPELEQGIREATVRLRDDPATAPEAITGQLLALARATALLPDTPSA